MILKKTVILPGDNLELSKRLITATLVEEDVVVVVIFGKDSNAEEAVKKADLRATKIVSGIERKVMWMTDVSQLGFLKSLLKDSDNYAVSSVDPQKHIGIAVTMTDVIRDILPITPAPDFIKLESSFIKASVL